MFGKKQIQSAVVNDLNVASSDLQQSAKVLLRRDFELAEINERYDRQLIEFNVMQEAILLANQLKDRRQMFEKVGGLLTGHLNYDRFFIIEQTDNGYKPLVAVGFDDRPFESKFELLVNTNALPTLFGEQPFWLFQPSDDALANEVISILNVSSVAIVHLQTPRFRALLGVAMDQPLDALNKEDINFLILMVSQLNVIVDNIDNYNQLARQNEELRLLDKAKTTFLSIASHQLRTPLSVMKFAISHLNKATTGILNPKQKEMVDEMGKSNSRIINLVNNLLNITRMEQGRLTLQPEPIQLHDLMQTIVEEQKNKIAEKRVQVSIDIPDIISLEGDKILIQESLTNLISNGVKYNRDGGLLIVKAQSMNDWVTITVGDTGIGVPREEQVRLFTQFFRSQQAQVIDPEGVGLGLYTTKQFIKLHGGDIMMNSIAGQGTTFAVRLPVRQPKVQAAEGANEVAGVANQGTPGVESK